VVSTVMLAVIPLANYFNRVLRMEAMLAVACELALVCAGRTTVRVSAGPPKHPTPLPESATRHWEIDKPLNKLSILTGITDKCVRHRQPGGTGNANRSAGEGRSSCL
jgi:hypothetical protein